MNMLVKNSKMIHHLEMKMINYGKKSKFTMEGK